MSDNFPLSPGSGRNAATDQVTHSGDTADVQLMRPVLVTGSEGSKTVVDLPGDGTNGLDVDVTRLPALVAGTANIGDVDVLTVPADPFGANADAASATGSISAKLRAIAANGIPITGDALTALQLIDDSIATTGSAVTAKATLAAGTDGTNARALKTDASGELQVDVLSHPGVAGTVAHDGSTANNPVNVGGRAVAHGTNPTAVAAGDVTDAYFNRAGVQFTIGGHPNVVSASARITGSNTDAALSPGTVNSGTKIVITRLTVNISNATTINVGVKIGFGASTIPADNTTGVAGVIVDNDGFPPGGGVNVGDGSGIIAIGGDGEELRITNDAPTSGTIHVSYSYFTIES